MTTSQLVIFKKNVAHWGKKNQTPSTFLLQLFVPTNQKKQLEKQLYGDLHFLIKEVPFQSPNDFILCLSRLIQSDSRLLTTKKIKKNKIKIEIKHDDKSYSLTLENQLLLQNPTYEETYFGRADFLFEASLFGVYQLVIKPFCSIATHIHKKTKEVEMPLTDGLTLQKKPVLAGLCHRWPLRFPHSYNNQTAKDQSILCLDIPAFQRNDETEIDCDSLKDLPDSFKSMYY